MRGIFGKPQGTCSRVSIVQALLLVRCKDNNNENLAQESLRGRTLSRHSNTALHYPLLLRKDYSIKCDTGMSPPSSAIHVGSLVLVILLILCTCFCSLIVNNDSILVGCHGPFCCTPTCKCLIASIRSFLDSVHSLKQSFCSGMF
ncbi:uncharacterized protein [Typha latifolia]|uniref:uncharacterized protein isoform X3 n=1 Tax=Typha latifolia TaxID=4733 RepID=UPI003C2B1529